MTQTEGESVLGGEEEGEGGGSMLVGGSNILQLACCEAAITRAAMGGLYLGSGK